MTPRPGIIDFFRGNRTTEPVITGELVPVTGSEVQPVTPKNENLIDFQKTLYDEWLDNEREKDIKWKMEMGAYAAQAEYTEARIKEAMRNL